MSMFSRIVAGVARREASINTLALPSVHTRLISGSSGIDKYVAPYPTLPRIEPSSSPTHAAQSTGSSSDIFSGLTTALLSTEITPSDRWISVHDGVLREPKAPGNVYTGRSVPVTDLMDVPSAYRRLHSILNRNRVRSELYLQRRYEKPSDRERRLKSERHRRRFAAWAWLSSKAQVLAAGG
ncbi:ribosomal protein S21 [Rhizoctonia solani]|uniref:Ribosomal protein S21 n=1 Tax=Rhizoctonia solani TaxID=456999 RepID=A0A8H8NP99_9AGAM|nr:ribosomal protein S21 [Rhizoctonia solani]QRW16297.1 ribosomal protein S21 [Rhizoctonia solani]